MRVLIVLMSFFLLAETSIDRVDLNLMDNEIAFTFFDLSDGEAVLIQNGTQDVLINTGSEESRQELFERLEVFKVHDIEKLILTNSGGSYTENTKEIIEKYDVQKLISSKAIFERLEEQINLPEKKIQRWKTGKQKDVIPGMETNVLYVTSGEKSEEAALVVRFQYGHEKVLYMGLADPEIEKKLSGNPIIDCQVLKVGDFGANEGTISRFLEKVDPQVAILFREKGTVANSKMLSRLDTVWVDVYRTYQTGTITIKFDPNSYNVFTIPIEEKESV